MGGFFGGMSPFGAFGAPGWGWDWMAPPASKDIQRSNGRWNAWMSQELGKWLVNGL